MGYSAYTVEVDFAIEPDKVDAALAAVNAEFGAEFGDGFVSLVDAVVDLSSFEECEIDAGGVFRLGHHVDKYLSATDMLLDVLGHFAIEGSVARFDGEDGSLFGFRVVNGQTCTEWGDYVWRLDSELPGRAAQEASA